jgi:lysophospholipase L1-like esterase
MYHNHSNRIRLFRRFGVKSEGIGSSSQNGKDENVKIKWVPIISTLSIISCFLCLAGLGWVIKDHFFKAPPMAASKQISTPTSVNTGNLQVVALGDSLTRGTGDPTGKGYVGYFIDNLKKQSKQNIVLNNLGIKGLTSLQLADQLKQPEVQRQIRSADLVLMTIGGNDLFRGGENLTDLNFQNINQEEHSFNKNLNGILTQIRGLNKAAPIYFIGLYNPFIQLHDSGTTSKIVREWNYKSAEVSAHYAKVVFVPTFDLFQLKMNDYLYSDHFHPNKKGYQLIAARLQTLITG